MSHGAADEPGGALDVGDLSSCLPGGRAGRAAIAILDAMQQETATRGHLAAAAERTKRLRAARELRSPERRLVSDALSDITRKLRRLRLLLGQKHPTAAALYLGWLLDRALDRGTAETLGLPGALVHALERFGVAVEPFVQRRRELAAKVAALTAEAPAHFDAAAVETIADALSYPGWIVAALLAELDLPRTLSVLSAQNQRAPLTARANLLKGTSEELAAALRQEGIATRPTELALHGLVLSDHHNAYGTRAFSEGRFELQDEGSQLIAELVAPPPSGIIVDACAGAGGKTLALGALLQNRGRLLALDVDERRLAELKLRARRAGLSNVQALCLRPDWTKNDLPPLIRERGAERVLVDAPCSGLGVLRRNPEARWRMTEKDVAEINEKQRRILQAAAGLVAPHGRLIYATCTILRRENDAIVAEFLEKNPDFRLVPAKEILGTARAERIGDGSYLRLFPSSQGMSTGPDGFFAAVLRRQSGVQE